MRFAVTGAGGFLGRRLENLLRESGHEMQALRRSGAQRDWTALEGADVVVHLAGEPVAQRWTPEVKRHIRDSRVVGTEELVKAISVARRRPRVLIAASAVGYYGDRGDDTLDETAEAGEGFLPDVCVEWERSADLAAALGLRVVKVRIGVVLGKEGGALKQMLPPFKLGLGAWLGDGRQWMPWIHAGDLVRLMLFAAENEALRGPINGTGPKPARNKEFTFALARALRRPALLPAPRFAVQLLFGEMAQILFHSQRVVPKAAVEAGFRFDYPELDAALRQILA